MSRNRPRILIFGAGAVGRGLVGELLAEAGWSISFLDVQPTLVTALRRDRSYWHRTVATADVKSKKVEPVEAGFSTDGEHVIAEISAATCAATSVGVRALPLIAPILREALLNRYLAGVGPLDILLCENLHKASIIMRDLLTADVDNGETTLLLDQTGLVETSIGRMIPAPEGAAERISEVAAEPYRFLPIDIAATKTTVFSEVPGLVQDRSVDFGFYSDRKLYIHNMGHFLCAILGQRAGMEYIWQAVNDPTIRLLTRAAMLESAVSLSTTYRYPIGGLVDHVDDLIHRFGNQALSVLVGEVG